MGSRGSQLGQARHECFTPVARAMGCWVTNLRLKFLGDFIMAEVRCSFLRCLVMLWTNWDHHGDLRGIIAAFREGFRPWRYPVTALHAISFARVHMAHELHPENGHVGCGIGQGLTRRFRRHARSAACGFGHAYTTSRQYLFGDGSHFPCRPEFCAGAEAAQPHSSGGGGHIRLPSNAMPGLRSRANSRGPSRSMT